MLNMTNSKLIQFRKQNKTKTKTKTKNKKKKTKTKTKTKTKQNKKTQTHNFVSLYSYLCNEMEFGYF